MGSKEELLKQIIFVHRVFGEDIRFRMNKITLKKRITGAISSFLNSIRSDSVDQANKKGQHVYRTISRKLCTPGLEELSDTDKRKLQNIILGCILKVGKIMTSPKTKYPRRLLLSKCSEQFISSYNELITSLENKWLLDYGVVSIKDLRIIDKKHLRLILTQAVHLKSVKEPHKELIKYFLSF